MAVSNTTKDSLALLSSNLDEAGLRLITVRSTFGQISRLEQHGHRELVEALQSMVRSYQFEVLPKQIEVVGDLSTVFEYYKELTFEDFVSLAPDVKQEAQEHLVKVVQLKQQHEDLLGRSRRASQKAQEVAEEEDLRRQAEEKLHLHAQLLADKELNACGDASTRQKRLAVITSFALAVDCLGGCGLATGTVGLVAAGRAACGKYNTTKHKRLAEAAQVQAQQHALSAEEALCIAEQAGTIIVQALADFSSSLDTVMQFWTLLHQDLEEFAKRADKYNTAKESQVANLKPRFVMMQCAASKICNSCSIFQVHAGSVKAGLEPAPVM